MLDNNFKNAKKLAIWYISAEMLISANGSYVDIADDYFKCSLRGEFG